jgi:hypothetical protein
MHKILSCACIYFFNHHWQNACSMPTTGSERSLGNSDKEGGPSSQGALLVVRETSVFFSSSALK